MEKRSSPRYEQTRKKNPNESEEQKQNAAATVTVPMLPAKKRFSHRKGPADEANRMISNLGVAYECIEDQSRR